MRIKRKTQIAIKKLALMVLVIALPIVIMPQVYDPLGVWLWDDTYQMVSGFRCANESCTLIRYPEGKMTFRSGWSATTDRSGGRITPDNAPTCTVHIALIGDSYTWGPSVRDTETWANRLAQQFPTACFHNYGQWGYNAEQALWTLEQQVPSDVTYVFYFVFQNDDMEPYRLHDPGPPPEPLNLLRYVKLAAWKFGWLSAGWGDDLPRNPQRFEAAIRNLARDPRVRFIGFQDELLVSEVQAMGFNVFGIGVPTKAQRVSPLDDHPNEAGHQFIAQQLYPLIDSLLKAHSTF